MSSYRQVSIASAFSLTAILADAYAKMGQAVSKGITEAMDRVGSPASRAQQKAMFEKVGEATKDAVLTAYDREIGGNGHATGYRRGTGRNGRLTGRLRPVLAANRNGTIYKVVAGPQASGGVRLQMFDTKTLDDRARHWARLNFGAGVAGAGSPRSYRLKIGRSTEDLSFGQGPRPGFRIPRGYWYAGPGGENVAPSLPVAGEAFYLRRQPGGGQFKQESKITRGIGGVHFLDEGLRTAAQALPVGINQLLVEMLGSKSRLRLRYDVAGSSRL